MVLFAVECVVGPCLCCLCSWLWCSWWFSSTYMSSRSACIEPCAEMWLKDAHDLGDACAYGWTTHVHSSPYCQATKIWTNMVQSLLLGKRIVLNSWPSPCMLELSKGDTKLFIRAAHWCYLIWPEHIPTVMAHWFCTYRLWLSEYKPYWSASEF